ncbi:TRAP transporter large permease subunit, partial [Aliarcobacter butzleri]
MIDLRKIALDSAQSSAVIFFTIAIAMIFAHFLTDEQIPQQITQVIIEANVRPLMFLLIVNLLRLVMGQFMEP